VFINQPTMITTKLSLALASSALAGFALFLLGISLGAFAFAGFSLATISLVLLAMSQDYAPRPHRFEPAAVPASRPSQRLPLAA
jgi:hypothetical protein